MNFAELASDLGFLTAAVFVAVVALVVIVLYAVAGTSAARARVTSRRIDGLRQRGFGGTGVAVRAGTSNIKRTEARSDIPGLEELARKFLPRRQMLVQRLERTGRPIAVGTYIMLCAVTAAIVCLSVTVLFKFPLVIGIFGGIAVGVGLPHVFIGYLISKRAAAFMAVFPEAIELIVRGLKSGLPISEEIGSVGREIVDPVGIEFRRVSDSVRFGQSLENALWDAARRVGIQDFNFFVISLSVQRETGGNLAETLGNLADILRKRRQMKLKIKALSSEAKASAIIIGSLPFIMFCVLFLLSPKYMSMLLTDPRGMMIGGVALTIQAFGAIVMAKMVRFEI